MPPTQPNMRGIVTVLNTPFRADDSLDVDGLIHHVNYALDAGVAGFLVPGLAAEVEYLGADERETMVHTVVETSAGRVPVIGGLAGTDTKDQDRLAESYLALGCSGLLINRTGKSEGELHAELTTLDALRPEVLMLQDWDPTGAGMDVTAVVRLFDSVPSFNWLKIEVIPAGPKYTDVLNATGGRLNVAGGWAVMQMIEALDRGVHAFMPTALHRTYVRICKLHADGQRDASRELFDRVLPILAFSNQRLDISVAFFKRLLHAQGVYETVNTRMPTARLDAAQERIADELIERAITLEDELA